MRIGIVSAENTNDVRSASGTPFYMSLALQKHCGDVAHLGPVPVWITLILRSLNLFSKIAFLVTKKRFKFTHSLLIASLYARYFDKKISRQSYEVIFAPVASTEIALLKSSLPVIYFSDATVGALFDYYDKFSNLYSSSKKIVDLIEKKALAKASLCIFSSEWAAKSAREHYGIAPEKIRIIPLGANIDEVPSPPEVESLIKDKAGSNAIRLVFLGTEWVRKGGDIAIEALENMRKAGLEAQMTIIGCRPPARAFRTEGTTIIPSLDKNKRGDKRTLKRVLSEAHFLILPTRAECTPIVFNEVCAFGVPVISTNTGGAPSVVTDGVNGFLLPPEAKGADYAGIILETFKDKKRYTTLASSARKEYEKKLNWDNWGKMMRQELSALL